MFRNDAWLATGHADGGYREYGSSRSAGGDGDGVDGDHARLVVKDAGMTPIGSVTAEDSRNGHEVSLLERDLVSVAGRQNRLNSSTSRVGRVCERD